MPTVWQFCGKTHIFVTVFPKYPDEQFNELLKHRPVIGSPKKPVPQLPTQILVDYRAYELGGQL